MEKTTKELWEKVNKTEKIANLLIYSRERWQDEKEYEDIADYLVEIQKAIPEAYKIYKRPFGVDCMCSDGVLNISVVVEGKYLKLRGKHKQEGKKPGYRVNLVNIGEREIPKDVRTTELVGVLKAKEKEIYVVVQRMGVDDFSFWGTEDLTDKNNGVSARGTKKDILEGIKEMIGVGHITKEEAIKLFNGYATEKELKRIGM